MASIFFLVHHTFKPGMAKKWWANMKNYYETKQKIHLENQIEAGVYCHTFMPTSKEGPMFCIWEAKEGVLDSDLQNFVNGPDAKCLHMGLDQPLNNHCQKIDHELIGGDGPYPRRFYG